MAFFERDGVRFRYEDSGGDGPAVLFSHGFLMDHTMFDPQIEALSDAYRCIRWDERGFGDTTGTGPFTYWDSADDAVAVLDHLGVDEASLVGMSQGGFLSLRAAIAYPDRVRALVLIDTQAGVDDDETLASYRGMLDAWVGGDDETRASIMDIVAGLIIAEPELSAEWITTWRAREPELIRHPGTCLVDRDDITDRVGEIDCPALVVHGTEDQAIPMDRARALCDHLSGCRGVVEVDGAAHASNLSHPDQVNPPLREFLDSID